MPTIILIEVLTGLKLKLTFSNGETLIVNFCRFFTPQWLPNFMNPDLFSQVTITEGGDGITWFNYVGFTVKELIEGLPDIDIEPPAVPVSVPWYKNFIWS